MMSNETQMPLPVSFPYFRKFYSSKTGYRLTPRTRSARLIPQDEDLAKRLVVLHWSSEDTELTSSGSPGHFLAANSGVVDEGGEWDNVHVFALSTLMVLGKTPAVNFALWSDSEGVISAGSDERCLDV